MSDFEVGSFEFIFPKKEGNPQSALVIDMKWGLPGHHTMPLLEGGGIMILPSEGDSRCFGRWWIQEVRDNNRKAYVTRAKTGKAANTIIMGSSDEEPHG